MALIADGLLIATALTAALYCAVLSRRLRRLADLESRLGVRLLTRTRRCAARPTAAASGYAARWRRPGG